MRKITAAIITFNEEKNIERCIKGLLNCVDEIVVFDSYSTDKTEEICSQYEVKFIQSKWEGYANTKNKLNDHIQADFIFSIDADEVPDEILKSEILKIKNEDFNGIYVLNRKTNYCGKWIRYCGWYPEYKSRIFPKDKAKWAGEFVHEYLSFNEEEKLKKLKGHLEHYSYYTKQEHKERADKYAILAAQKYYMKQKKTYVLQPLISAVTKFIHILIIKKGFMDGYYGFQIAWISAGSNYLKYKELKRLIKTNK